jgi:hypothetical protein
MTMLSNIHANELFTLRGHTYRATSDAVSFSGTIRIKAERRNGAMPSGWELADIMEWDDVPVTNYGLTWLV